MNKSGPSGSIEELTKQPTPSVKKTRQKKTVLACLPCQKSHYPCDERRPCQSCQRRGKSEACIDGKKKRAKYMEAATRDIGEPLMLLAHTAGGESVTEDVVRPFNYGASYHRLIEMLQGRLSGENMSKVCKALAQFRPNMIAQIRTLGESDLILMERAFQRTVLELQKILPLTGAAHCVWRRTGEISFALREFCILTGWTANSLCSRSIHEILDEVTVVEYWERYAGCVTDSAEHYFCLTNGGILRPDGKCVRGSFWITVRKDIFDIPLAIVGCFIPNLWHCKT